MFSIFVTLVFLAALITVFALSGCWCLYTKEQRHPEQKFNNKLLEMDLVISVSKFISIIIVASWMMGIALYGMTVV